MDRLQDIADKIISNTPLSPRESSIFNNKTAEVNALIRDMAESHTNNLLDFKSILLENNS